LRELARLEERPFRSRVPLVGPLIAAFRAAWNNVSTRWYVRPMADQQTLFNLSAVEEFEAWSKRADELAVLRAETEALRHELTRLSEWLIDQDRDQSHLRHDLAELSVVVGQHARAVAEAQSDSENRPPAAHA
jgi:hypothetical protein